MSVDTNASQKGPASRTAAALGSIAAWAWAVAAGGGGLVLLLMKGPWPLTNGWFAMLSGVAACPPTASLLKKYLGVTVSGRIRFGAAALLFIAGRIALAAGPDHGSTGFFL